MQNRDIEILKVAAELLEMSCSKFDKVSQRLSHLAFVLRKAVIEKDEIEKC